MRRNDNLQTITPEEVKARMTEAFLKAMSERFAPPGELFHEWYVRNARENGWIAKTEDEIIEHIVFGVVVGGNMSVFEILHSALVFHVNAFYGIVFFMQTNFFLFLGVPAAAYLAYSEIRAKTSLEIDDKRRLG